MLGSLPSAPPSQQQPSLPPQPAEHMHTCSRVLPATGAGSILKKLHVFRAISGGPPPLSRIRAFLHRKTPRLPGPIRPCDHSTLHTSTSSLYAVYVACNAPHAHKRLAAALSCWRDCTRGKADKQKKRSTQREAYRKTWILYSFTSCHERRSSPQRAGTTQQVGTPQLVCRSRGTYEL